MPALLSHTLTALTFAAALVAADISFPLPYKALDCSAYPPMDVAVEGVPEFTAQVDLSQVPNLPPNVYDPNGAICQQHTAQSSDYCNGECGCRASADVVGCKDAGHWAPTYDDGPSPFTPKILDTLKAHGDAKGIFFVIGSRLCQNSNHLIDAINAGHEIGVHTWSHPRLTSRTNEQVIAEIKWTEKAIMEVTGGIKPVYMRPPYGNIDERVQYLIAKMGYIPVLWGPDTNDWNYNYITNPNKKQITDGTAAINRNLADYITANQATLPGTIALEHDIAEIPTTAAGSVLDTIVKAGWKLVPMTTCTGAESWAQNYNLNGGAVPVAGTTVTENNQPGAAATGPLNDAKPGSADAKSAADAVGASSKMVVAIVGGVGAFLSLLAA